MADTAADYRARAAADLAEAQQLVLPHARDRKRVYGHEQPTDSPPPPELS